MGERKSNQRIPDFAIDDITRRFALWLQQRCREKPGFEGEIAQITFTATSTVQQWRHGQRPGTEALLRALAYGGPRAVNEVLLEPMGMAGARLTEDSEVEGALFVARRELDAAIAAIASHPNSAEVRAATELVTDILGRITQATKLLNELRNARSQPEPGNGPGVRLVGPPRGAA